MKSTPSFNRWASLLFLSIALGFTVERAVAGFIEGGTSLMVLIPAGNYGGTARSSPRRDLNAFYIGKYEVTWSIFQKVRNWAVNNGYPDLANVGAGRGPDHPVTNVSWYDVVKWCNAYSELNGKTPVYSVAGLIYRTGERDNVTVDRRANGYRLPTEDEWTVAFKGAKRVNNFVFSGSNNADEVAWYNKNSARQTHRVGQKRSNELGIYDMSGNVSEWTEEHNVTYLWVIPIGDNQRFARGGDWFSDGGAWVGYPSSRPGPLTASYPDSAVMPFARSAGIGFRIVTK